MLIVLLLVGGMQKAAATFPPLATFGYVGSGHAGCGMAGVPLRTMSKSSSVPGRSSPKHPLMIGTPDGVVPVWQQA